VNESKIVDFLRLVWWFAGKKRVFGKRRGEDKIEGKKSHRTCEN